MAGASKKNPNKITNTPPSVINKSLYWKNNEPPSPNNVPNAIKTALNPITYKTPFRKIFERAFFAFSGCCKSESDEPEIKLKYPGTRGSVHGAKNVMIPAIKAEIIKAKL